MNDTLKVAGRIGAELGAAKAENEKLRTALKDLIGLAEDQICQHHNTHRGGAIWEICDDCGMKWADDMGGRPEFMWPDEIESARTALSQKAEPTDTYTATDMATAAAQGFRDGQAAVEQAAAQDELPQSGVTIEKDMFGTVHIKMGDFDYIQIQYQYPYTDNASQNVLAKRIAELLTRPAQAEQQPFGWVTEDYLTDKSATTYDQVVADRWRAKGWPVREIYTAPIAQTAPQGKFRMGDLVKKSTGSEWVGHVCGWYSTEQTPEGYAVESSAHRNSVQIYPAKALEAV